MVASGEKNPAEHLITGARRYRDDTLPDSRLQAHFRLHGVGNQTVRLGFLDQLLGFGHIGIHRERDGRLQRDGRELKLPLD